MRAAVCVVLFVLTAWSGAAQTPPTISLPAVIEEARAHSPAIAAAASRAAAARQRPLQEAALPSPVVSAGYNSSGSPLPGAGLGVEPTANIGVEVMQDLPGRGKRDLRVAVATREAEASAEEVEVAVLAVVSRVRALYYQFVQAHETINVLTRNRDLLETLLRVSEVRYGVGRTPQQDVLKAQAELSLLELRLERLRQEHAAHESELNILLGRERDSPLGEPAPLELKPFDMQVADLLFEAQTRAPALKRHEALIARAEAAVEVAKRDAKPDFAVSAGYSYMGAMPSMYMARVDVKLPPRRGRLAASIGEQVGLLAAARQEYDAELQSITVGVAENQRAVQTASRLARLYRDTVLPQVKLALESSIVGYQTGSVDFLSVLTNAGGVLENEMRYIEELGTYHLAISRLEELTGTTLVH